MSEGTRDKVTGTLDNAKGNVKETAGDLTNNDKLRNEGAMDQVSGDVKQGVGEVKDKVSGAVDKLKGDR
jgi:uncharacterized protein YjbJ (UPF0337 family)